MYDIGCSLGRWVCWYATKPIQKSVGIELREEFVAIAERQRQDLNGRIAPTRSWPGTRHVDYSEAVQWSDVPVVHYRRSDR